MWRRPLGANGETFSLADDGVEHRPLIQHHDTVGCHVLRRQHPVLDPVAHERRGLGQRGVLVLALEVGVRHAVRRYPWPDRRPAENRPDGPSERHEPLGSGRCLRSPPRRRRTSELPPLRTSPDAVRSRPRLGWADAERLGPGRMGSASPESSSGWSLAPRSGPSTRSMVDVLPGQASSRSDRGTCRAAVTKRVGQRPRRHRVDRLRAGTRGSGRLVTAPKRVRTRLQTSPGVVLVDHRGGAAPS